MAQIRRSVDENGKKNSHVYHRLYESYRDSTGKVRQHFLISLDLEDIPSWKDRHEMCQKLNDMVVNGSILDIEKSSVNKKITEVYMQLQSNGVLSEIQKLENKNQQEQVGTLVESTLKNIHPRQVGAEYVCLSTLKRLGLRSFLAFKQWSKEQIDLAFIQIAARAIYLCSEHKTVSYLRENSALCNFFNINPEQITKDNLYNSARRLYDLHLGIEDYLHSRICSMFDMEDKVLLFDLTNSYFESTKLTNLRQFGRSKEKRSDCPIVVLGAVVNTEGMLVRTSIFSENTSDCSTMQEIMKTLNPPSTEGKKKIVVMDAGISTSDHLSWLKTNGYDYITVRRGGSTDKYKTIREHLVTVYDTKNQPIEIQFAEIEGITDTLLLVDSHAKTLKEKSMHYKASLRYEDGLKSIENGLLKKGGIKKRDKVNERLGRLKEHCGSIQNDYEVNFTYAEKDIVTSMTWKRKADKIQQRSTSEERYIVQTTLKGYDETHIWMYYNIIRRVETTFSILKLDLDIRPIYHQTDEGTKAHFHLAILAYWIVSTVQYQLKKKGITCSWRDLLRIMSTQSVVSTIAERVDGDEVEIRQCTEPEERLFSIYDKLNLESPPLKKKRKICVVHFEKKQKNTT